MKKRGFTLIEVLAVITITGILIVISLTSFYLLRRKVSVNESAQKIVSTLRLAQNKTLASEGSSSYGVRFDSLQNQFVLFKGGNFSSSSENNEVFKLPSDISIASISLSSGSLDVIFNRLDGNTDEFGTVKIISLADPNESKTLFISQKGEVSTEDSVPPTDARQTDTRHVHFDLGWSIQESSTLTLNFPDTPEITENVNMASYFNADKTEFDWENQVDVNGENQGLRVHTLVLDIVNTTLCIHRDGRENNKPLNILIDNKDIASYTATGSVSVGLFGGEFEIQ